MQPPSSANSSSCEMLKMWGGRRSLSPVTPLGLHVLLVFGQERYFAAV